MSAVAVPIKRAAASATMFAALLGVSLVAPLLGLHQLVTGTIVNAVLLVATVLLGPTAAVGIGVLPSLFALVSGQLPAPLAPMVPFIIVGNALLVGVFHALLKRDYWLGATTAAVVKFGWLFGTVSLLVASTDLLPGPVAVLAATMMGWPQLVTALAGGLIAYGILRAARRL